MTLRNIIPWVLGILVACSYTFGGTDAVVGYGDTGYGADIGFGSVGYPKKDGNQKDSSFRLGMPSFGNIGLGFNSGSSESSEVVSTGDGVVKKSFIFVGFGIGFIEDMDYGRANYNGLSLALGWQNIFRQGFFTPVVDIALSMNNLSHEEYEDAGFFDLGLDFSGIARFNIAKFFMEIGATVGLAVGGFHEADAGIETGIEIGFGLRLDKMIVGFREVVYLTNPWFKYHMIASGQMYVGF